MASRPVYEGFELVRPLIAGGANDFLVHKLIGREQPGQACLAGARRAPQQQRGKVAPSDAPAQGTSLADEVFLPDKLLEVPRSHPGRERLALGGWLEERLGSGAGYSPGGHGRMVAPINWPVR